MLHPASFPAPGSFGSQPTSRRLSAQQRSIGVHLVGEEGRPRRHGVTHAATPRARSRSCPTLRTAHLEPCASCGAPGKHPQGHSREISCRPPPEPRFGVRQHEERPACASVRDDMTPGASTRLSLDTALTGGNCSNVFFHHLYYKTGYICCPMVISQSKDVETMIA